MVPDYRRLAMQEVFETKLDPEVSQALGEIIAGYAAEKGLSAKEATVLTFLFRSRVRLSLHSTSIEVHFGDVDVAPELAAAQRPVRAATTLLDLLHASYVFHHGLSPGTVKQFEISIRLLERWAGRNLHAEDLTRELVTGWIDWLVKSGRAPATIASKRKDILALWRWAAQEGLASEEPKKIRSIAIPRRDPVAWTKPELLRLLAACLLLKGKLRNGVSRAGCMVTLAWVLYSTGLRLSACLALKRADLREDGSIVAHWWSQKTPYSQTVNLLPEAIEACNLLGHHELLIPWSQGKRSLWRWWKRALKEANLPVNRRTGPQQMRRTAATWLEVEHDGAATAFLGHRTGDLARRNYLDPRILQAHRRLPPNIFEGAAQEGEAVDH